MKKSSSLVFENADISEGFKENDIFHCQSVTPLRFLQQDEPFSTENAISTAIGDKLDVLLDDDNMSYPRIVHSEADDDTLTNHYENDETWKLFSRCIQIKLVHSPHQAANCLLPC